MQPGQKTRIFTPVRNRLSFFPLALFFLLGVGTFPALLAQGDTIEMLRKSARQAGSDTARVRLLYALGQEYVRFQPDSAQAVGQQMLALARAAQFARGEVLARSLLVHTALEDGAIGPAQAQLDQLTLVAASQADTVLRGYSRLASGTLLAARGDYTQASEELFRAQRTFAGSGNTAALAEVYLQLGLVQQARKRGGQAASHSKDAWRLFSQLQNRSQANYALVSLGMSYRSIGNLDSALICLQQALEGYRKLGDELGMATTFTQIGTTYREKNSLPQAEASLKQALDLLRQAGNANQRWKREAFIESGRIALGHHNGAAAKALLDSSLFYARAASAPQDVMTCYGLLADAHALMQDYGAAFRYERLYAAKKDSLTDIRRTREAEELEKRYQTARNEEEIKLRGEQIRNQRLQIYSLGAVALSVLILAAFLFFNIQEKRRANRILEERVENRTERLNRTMAQLQTSNQELDTFLYRSSHDLKGPVSTLQGLCNIAKMDEDNTQTYLGHIERVVNNMDGMVLAIIAVDSVNRIEVTPSHFELMPLLLGAQESWREMPGYTDRLILDFDVPNGAEITTDPVLLTEALLSLFSHTGEHCAKEGGALVLSYIPETGEFTVVHDAYYVEEENAGKLFNMFYRLSATERGFGLTLYRARVAFQKMGYQVESRALSGGKMKFGFAPTLTESEALA